MRLRALLGPPVLLGLLWAAAIWWPSQMAINSAEEDLNSAESQQLLMVTDIDRLTQSSDQAVDLDADLESVARLIPSEPHIDTFLGALASAAEASGVRVNLVSPTGILDASTTDPTRPVPTGVSATTIAIEAEGSYDSVMRFVSGLDDLPRLAVVDQIGMVAIEGDTQVIVVDVTLRVFSGGGSNEEFSG